MSNGRPRVGEEIEFISDATNGLGYTGNELELVGEPSLSVWWFSILLPCRSLRLPCLESHSFLAITGDKSLDLPSRPRLCTSLWFFSFSDVFFIYLNADRLYSWVFLKDTGFLSPRSWEIVTSVVLKSLSKTDLVILEYLFGEIVLFFYTFS